MEQILIVYKLKCSNSHEFDGWFKSMDSFEEQMSGKMIFCPVCGDSALVKVLTSTRSIKSTRSSSVESGSDTKNRMAYALMKKISQDVRKNFENVGERFPQEARKIHYGETPARNIYGTTSREQENALKDEGIEFFKFPAVKDTDD